MSSRRTFSRLAALLSSLAAVAFAGGAAAHAEHYGQSAFVTVGRSVMKVELDLSPGSLVAKQVLSLLDSDADGRLSPAEKQAYASAVLRDLALQIDDHPLSLSVASLDVPQTEHLATGQDKMILTFTAAPSQLEPGAHRLVLRNAHKPVQSAYQAYALAESKAITLRKQTHDATQEELICDFEVAAPEAPAPEGSGSPPLLALALVLGACVAAGAFLVKKK